MRRRVISVISMTLAVVYTLCRRGDAAGFVAICFNLIWVMNAFGLLGEDESSLKQRRETE